MRPTSQRPLLTRFLALLLTLGQIAWTLPAHAQETLRPAQEVETRASGLEEVLRSSTGLEEQAAGPFTLNETAGWLAEQMVALSKQYSGFEIYYRIAWPGGESERIPLVIRPQTSVEALASHFKKEMERLGVAPANSPWMLSLVLEVRTEPDESVTLLYDVRLRPYDPAAQTEQIRARLDAMARTLNALVFALAKSISAKGGGTSVDQILRGEEFQGPLRQAGMTTADLYQLIRGSSTQVHLFSRKEKVLFLAGIVVVSLVRQAFNQGRPIPSDDELAETMFDFAGSVQGQTELRVPEDEVTREDCLALVRRIKKIAGIAPAAGLEEADRFEAIERRAQAAWQELLAGRTESLQVAVVVPAYHADVDRIEKQQSLLRKFQKLQELADAAGGKEVTFTVYVVDDKPLAPGRKSVAQAAEEQYARSGVDGTRVQLKTLRLENAIRDGDPGAAGLKSPRESIKWGSVRLGLHTAVREGAHAAVMTDSDSSQSLTQIPNLLVPILRDGAAAAVGSRFVEGAVSTGMPVHNYLEMFLFNPMVRAVFPEIGPVRDVQSGFKAYSAQALRDALPRMATYRLAGDAELLYLVAREGGRVAEVARSEWDEDPKMTTINAARYMDFVEQVRLQAQAHKGSAVLEEPAEQLAEAIAGVEIERWRAAEPRFIAAAARIQAGEDPEQVAAELRDILFPAGLEEGTVIRLVPVREYPPVQADPGVRGQLPEGGQREAYDAYVAWLNDRALRPPREYELARSVGRAPNPNFLADLDHIERLAADSPLPVFVIYHRGKDAPVAPLKDFLAAYLAHLSRNGGALPEGAVPIPAEWSWNRLVQVLSDSGEMLRREDRRIIRLLAGISVAAQASAPPPLLVEPGKFQPADIAVYEPILSGLPNRDDHPAGNVLRAYVSSLNANGGALPTLRQVLERAQLDAGEADQVFREVHDRVREQGAVPVFVRPQWAEPDGDLSRVLTAYLSRRFARQWREQAGQEIPLPEGWDLDRLYDFVERHPHHLAPFMEVDPEGLGQLVERVRRVGRATLPGRHFTEDQFELIEAYSRLVQHPVESRALPTQGRLADALRIPPAQAKARMEEVRRLFQGERAARIFPLWQAEGGSLLRRFEDGMRACAADDPSAAWEFNGGRLVAAYNAFLRLADPQGQAPVSLRDFAGRMGVSPEEAQRRFQELDRLMDYLGLPLARSPMGDFAPRLSDAPRFTPLPVEESPVERALEQLFQRVVRQPSDWEFFEQLGWDAMLEEGGRLPAQPRPEFSMARLKARVPAAGLEENEVGPRLTAVEEALEVLVSYQMGADGGGTVPLGTALKSDGEIRGKLSAVALTPADLSQLIFGRPEPPLLSGSREEAQLQIALTCVYILGTDWERRGSLRPDPDMVEDLEGEAQTWADQDQSFSKGMKTLERSDLETLVQRTRRILRLPESSAGLEEDFEAMLARAPGIVLDGRGAKTPDGLLRFDFEGNAYLGIRSADVSPGFLRVSEAVFSLPPTRSLVIADSLGGASVVSDDRLSAPFIRGVRYDPGSGGQWPVLTLRVDARKGFVPRKLALWAKRHNDEASDPVPVTLLLEAGAGLEETASWVELLADVAYGIGDLSRERALGTLPEEEIERQVREVLKKARARRALRTAGKTIDEVAGAFRLLGGLSPREIFLSAILMGVFLEKFEEDQTPPGRVTAAAILGRFRQAMPAAAQAQPELYSGWERTSDADYTSLIERVRAAILFAAGLEELAPAERWRGMRSAAPELRTVVIGPSVAERFPGLRALAGLEERFLVDDGAGTVTQLITQGAEAVSYYGGLEESARFTAMAGEALIRVEARLATDGDFLAQLERILLLAGIPQEVLAAGLEEFAAELGTLAVGA